MESAMRKRLPIVLLAGLLLSASVFAAENFCPREGADPGIKLQDSPQFASGDKAQYDGTLRLYLVEPASRWRDYGGHNYEFGFLWFPEVTAISLADGETYYNEVETAYGGMHENNIAVIGVLFNAQGYQQEAYPGNGYYFTAHYNDLAAYAEPGAVGVPPETEPGFTHAVFIEEGTATW